MEELGNKYGSRNAKELDSLDLTIFVFPKFIQSVVQTKEETKKIKKRKDFEKKKKGKLFLSILFWKLNKLLTMVVVNLAIIIITMSALSAIMSNRSCNTNSSRFLYPRKKKKTGNEKGKRKINGISNQSGITPGRAK